VSDADLRTIALWELMRGAEKAVPDIKGCAEAYLKSLSKHEIDLIRRYDKIRGAEAGKLADLFEKKNGGSL